MEDLMSAFTDVSYLLLALGMVLIAKLTLDLLTPFRVDDQVSARDNPAFGVSLVGYYLAVLIIFTATIIGELERPLWLDLLSVAGWTLLGILLLNLSRVLLDRAVLHRFSTRKEIVEDGNTGMGAVEFGTYVGSALVIAGAISGTGGGLDTALVFYGLGQLALILYALLYQRLTAYDFHQEIERDNAAAGIAYGGSLIAMGTILMGGSAGDFLGWSQHLIQFAWSAAAAFLLLVIGRWAIDQVLLPGRTLHQEIATDRNLNAGLLEGGVILGLAAVAFFTI